MHIYIYPYSISNNRIYSQNMFVSWDAGQFDHYGNLRNRTGSSVWWSTSNLLRWSRSWINAILFLISEDCSLTDLAKFSGASSLKQKKYAARERVRGCCIVSLPGIVNFDLSITYQQEPYSRFEPFIMHNIDQWKVNKIR